jgi:hypothetical protein
MGARDRPHSASSPQQSCILESVLHINGCYHPYQRVPSWVYLSRSLSFSLPMRRGDTGDLLVLKLALVAAVTRPALAISIR